MTKKKINFLRKAKLKHGNKYDYAKVRYVNKDTKITIICSKHGEVKITPSAHLKGSGCPKCSRLNALAKKRKKLPKFKTQAKKIHNNKYDYSLVNSENRSVKIKIICPKHGVFEQLMSTHLLGKGCNKCGNERISKARSIDVDEFIKRVNKIHNNKYDYGNTNYINSRSKVDIVCPKHGKFTIRASAHIDGQGCRLCGNEKISKTLRSNTKKFIAESKKVHGDKYDYSKVNYRRECDKVIIICPKHGKFSQAPRNHKNGNGCPKCVTPTSKGELEVLSFIDELGISTINSDRTILNGNEIDILLPTLGMGLEYNGLFWHSSYKKKFNYHLNKTIQASKKEIKLIHIFEDEWVNNSDIIKLKIKSLVGIGTKVDNLKCINVSVNSRKYCSYINDKLVSTFNVRLSSNEITVTDFLLENNNSIIPPIELLLEELKPLGKKIILAYSKDWYDYPIKVDGYSIIRKRSKPSCYYIYNKNRYLYEDLKDILHDSKLRKKHRERKDAWLKRIKLPSIYDAGTNVVVLTPIL